MQVAGVLTAVAFVVWITTLPLRFGGTGAVVAEDTNGGAEQTQLAGVGAIDTGNGTTLEVVDPNAEETGTANFSNY